MSTLQPCLSSMMGRPITMEQLREEVGIMVERLTAVTRVFRRMQLKREEYVCLKVITLLGQSEFLQGEYKNLKFNLL